MAYPFNTEPVLLVKSIYGLANSLHVFLLTVSSGIIGVLNASTEGATVATMEAPVGYDVVGGYSGPVGEIVGMAVSSLSGSEDGSLLPNGSEEGSPVTILNASIDGALLVLNTSEVGEPVGGMKDAPVGYGVVGG